MAGEWREVKLGEVVSLNPDTIGGDWPCSYIKYIDISSVGEGLILEPPQVLRLDEAPSRAKRLVQEGDTVLSTVRPGRRSMFFGKQADPEWVVSTGFAVLRPRKECIEPRYLYACVYHRAFTQFLVRREKGAAYPAVLPEDIADAVIKLPPLPEQRAIAHILGTLDDKIELNRRTSETLEAMARALFKSWFVDFEPVRAKCRGDLDGRPRWQRGGGANHDSPQQPGLPAHLYDLFPDRLVESELGEIPEGWRVGNLRDVAENLRRGVQPDCIAPNTPYIALEHMPRRCIALFDWGTAEGIESNKFEFKKGEILFGKLRPYFHKVGVAPVDGVCSTDIVVIAPRRHVWTAFVLGHLSSVEFVDYTNAGSSGTKMPRTSWADMARYEIALPPEPVAEAFNTLVQPLTERIISGIHESRTLAALRDALLPKLISGKIRVKDAEKFLKERRL